MKTKNTTIKKVLCLALALCMMMALSVSAFATNVNEAVRDSENGVLQVYVVYTTDDGQELFFQGGSGFLINDTTLVTCEHVAKVNADDVAEIAQYMNTSVADATNHLSLRVSVLRDVSIKAKIQYSSTEMDYAILTLDTPIYDRTPLALRSSSEVEKTESCYALGFPAEIEYLQSVNKYNSEDVSITSGQVNKISSIEGVDYVQHSAKTMAGNSGGPLVDNDGKVIGISCMVSSEESYSYAIASDQLIEICKSLGIEYSSDGRVSDANTGDPTEVTEPSVDKTALQNAVNSASSIVEEDYSEDSVAAFKSAFEKANSVLGNAAATQAEVDAAANALNSAVDELEVKSGLSKGVIIGIAAAVVAVVVVVVLIIVLGGKKKKAAPVAPVMPQMPENKTVGQVKTPSAPPFTVNQGGMNTTVLNQGSGETTVLSQGSNETTVLSQNTSFGSLLRKKNNEKISINKAKFSIGKERSNVDYCVSDNTAVSRVHVVIRANGGKIYVADQRSTNGTFVNNVRVESGKEVELKSGDKLTLGDEDFIFNS